MKPYKIILIDDDNFSNIICTTLVKSTFNNVNVISFLDPFDGLEYLQKEEIKDESNSFINIILLDINMPEIDGWEFLDKFETFDEKIKSAYHIFIISSSVDSEDIQKAKSHNHVLDFISKPLSREQILSFIEMVMKRIKND